MKSSKLLMIINFMAMVGILGISSCDDENDPAPGITLSADAGADQTIGLGNSVTLDGSASTSSDTASLDYSWEVANGPAGSTPSLTGASTATPVFTPDEAGEYTINLTISSQGVQDSDEVLIIVEEITGPQEIGGVIDVDTSLPDIVSDPDMPDYIASSSVDVRAELTVEPGVVIHFAEDRYLDIESETGTIIAEGTENKPIVFTSSNVASEIRWRGIYIASVSALNSFDFVTVSYAGNSNFNFSGPDHPAGLGIENTGKVSVTNSTFSNNAGYGFYVDDGGGQIEQFGNNTFENNEKAMTVPADEVEDLDNATTFSNNANADVEIFQNTYSETKSSTWPELNGDAAYLVSGDLTIEGDLTIAPGAKFEFREDVIMTVNGTLKADGVSDNRITFTTSNLEGQLHWKGIYIPSSSSLNSLSFVDILYAGNSEINFSGPNHASGLGVENTGKVSVENCNISHSNGYGLYVDDGGGVLESFADNHFENNIVGVGVPADEVSDIDSNTTFADNSNADVEIFQTTFSSTNTGTWNPLNGDAAYTLSGDLIVDGELSMAPGVTIEVNQDVLIKVNGLLMAEGTTDDRITFTSSNIEGGILWKGLIFDSADARNILNYVVVEYAGSSNYNFSGPDNKANVGVDSGAKLTVTNSEIVNGDGYSIFAHPDATLIESDNTLGDPKQL